MANQDGINQWVILLKGDLEIHVKYIGDWLFKVKAKDVDEDVLEYKIDKLCIELQRLIQDMRTIGIDKLLKGGRVGEWEDVP